MATGDPTVPEIRFRLHVRRLAAVAIVAPAVIAAYLVLTQPAIGSLNGLCRDSKSGKPMANVFITITQVMPESNSGDEYSAEYHAETPIASLDPVGRSSAPGGWAQNTAHDDSFDIAGANKEYEYSVTAQTDDQGKFSYTNLPVGEYRLTTDSSTVAYAEQTVVVEEGKADTITFDVNQQTQQSISFESAEAAWLPTERPTFGIDGTLNASSLKMTLERIDVDDLLSKYPGKLSQGTTDSSATDWKGKYTVVRTWTQQLKSQDGDGSYNEHVAASDTPLPAGVYLLKAETTGDASTAIGGTVRFQVTDLALVTKTTAHQVKCFVADLSTGSAQSGITTTLYQNGNTPAFGVATTDSSGLATLDLSKAAKESRGLLVARRGDSIAVVSISMNSPGDNSDSSDQDSNAVPTAAGAYLRSLTYTDRPIYRPGDLVHLKGIMRLYDSVKGYVVPANQAVNVEIKDSQDNVVQNQTVTTNAMGSWTCDYTMNSEALTGQYSINAALGDQVSSATFDVASYHKPEYQVTITPDKQQYVHGDTVHATVAASYYFGAPVAGAKAHIDVMRTDEGDSSASDSGDSESSGSGEPKVSEDVVLDPQGHADVEFATKDNAQQSGDATYTISAVVTDPSGADISSSKDITVAQGDFSLQLGASSEVAHAGDTIVLTATAINPDKKPRAGQAVTVAPSYSTWTNGKYDVTKLPPLTGVTDSSGETLINFTIPKSGEVEFAASGKDDRGNTVTTEAFVWASSDTTDVPGRYSDLQLILDKNTFVPGDTVHALVNTDHPGASALVTVEGRQLYQSFVIPMSKRSTQVDVKLTQDLTPGVTISVCTVINKQFLTSSTDASISDPQRPLKISITPSQPKFHPGDTATVAVMTTDQNGTPVPAEVSIDVVDSSIYAIMEDSTPDIADAFEPSQGDSVQTSNSCERIYYGDVDKGAANIRIRSKFVDTALWQPDVMTGPDGKGQVSFTLPDNLTTWRITAHGHTADTRVGTQTATFEVNKDLLVRVEAPAFLNVGDTATVVGLVHNNTAQTIHTHVTFAALGLRLIGDQPSDLDVVAGVPAKFTWQVRAESAGPATLTMTASGGGLSDGAQMGVPVEPHGVNVTTWQAGAINTQADVPITIDPKAIPASSFVRLHLSPSLASSIFPVYDYLSQYPYECADSTASVLTADAILAGTTSLHGTPNAGFNFSAANLAKMRDEIDRSLLRLERMQQSSGGWGWFPGSSGPDAWSSSNVAWALLVTRDAGFSVKQSLLDAAAKATADGASQIRETKIEKYVDIETLSMCALVLARRGDRDAANNCLRYIQRYWNKHTLKMQTADIARCSLAYAALQGPSSPDAHRLMGDLWSIARVTGAEVSITAYNHSSAEQAGVELPDVDATAWLMMAAEHLSHGDSRIDGVARWLMANRTGDHWIDPTDSALVLQALTQYVTETHELTPNFNAQVSVNGVTYSTTPMGPNSIYMPDTVVDIPASSFVRGANTIHIAKVGVGHLYYSVENRQCVEQSGPPAPVPFTTRVWRAFFAGQPALAPAASGYRIKRTYLRMTTRRNWFWEDTVPAPEAAFNTKEDILVRLIINATRPGSKLIVSEPIPAGCIVTDLAYDECEEWSNWWDSTDVRDDKVNFFIADMSTGEHEIDYHLHVQTPGKYDALPAFLTSEIDPTLQAIGTTSHITVDQGPD